MRQAIQRLAGKPVPADEARVKVETGDDAEPVSVAGAKSPTHFSLQPEPAPDRHGSANGSDLDRDAGETAPPTPQPKPLPQWIAGVEGNDAEDLWLGHLLKKIQPSVDRAPACQALSPPTDSKSAIAEAAQADEYPVEWTLVIGDTEGDVLTLRRNLELVGLVNEQGAVAAEISPSIKLLDQGDAIRKQAPDGAYLAYLQEVKRTAPDGFQTVNLAGNHELERLRAGLTPRQAKAIERDGLSADWLLNVIREMDIFHLAPPMLYLHGYPTIEFLRLLWSEFVEKGKDAGLLNQRFRDAIRKGGKNIDDWRYMRNAGTDLLLYDIGDAVRYFAVHGPETSLICRQLGVHTIVIGHRPCRTGMQEIMVLSGDGKGKKAGKAATTLHNSLMKRIRTGKPLVVDQAWPNNEVVILRNDVLGKGNRNLYGMLLVRKTEEQVEMLTVNANHHLARRIRAFMATDNR